ncbi:uncharacterized protein LOC130712134 [Lotus japonicus]|uniref:uncharacterized protein LOC130712134 n=1 Tax=Lotus japonicus TaxID=34305 RepID=UPI002584D4DC|nr:uncharacterized protein LOC130712134 [Lotus japonicus]
MEEKHTHIMKDSNYVKSQQEEEEEKEEALSLCDLPLHNYNSTSLNDDESSLKNNLQFQPSSLLDTSEFFNGFSSSGSSDMCPADEIIFRGRLVPFNEKDKTHDPESADKKVPHRRRSESLSSVTRSNSESTTTTTGTGSRRHLMRSSKSLNYTRLKESAAPEVHRNSSSRSAAPPSEKKATKPRWYSLMFGAMKVPPEMELNDMKNRQVRRNPSTSMFPAADHGEKVAENRSSGKVSWRILKALSCKDHRSVAVTTTSFAMPQAS